MCAHFAGAKSVRFVPYRVFFRDNGIFVEGEGTAKWLLLRLAQTPGRADAETPVNSARRASPAL